MTTIPFANIFQPLIDVFDAVLVFFHDHVGLSWGFSIIALTICVRAVLLPLAFKQVKSMQGLQKIAPQMKALQEKYKGDKQRLQEETMKLYREAKVNPFGSCLPLVLQLPVFLSLFYMLRKDLKIDICGPKSEIAKTAASLGKSITQTGCDKVDPGSAGFLFINDLTDRATGGVLVVLLVLYVGSQLLSGILMSVTADRNQRMIMLALPFIFVPFIQGFPAGLIVYWITTNLWTVGQQYIIRRSAGMPVRGAPTPTTSGGLAGFLGGGQSKREDDTKPQAAAVADEPRRSRRERAAAPTNGKDGAEPAAGPPKPRTAPPPPPRRRKKKTGRRR
jgi:YidC/Oxa1 family membrane protein insertase